MKHAYDVIVTAPEPKCNNSNHPSLQLHASLLYRSEAVMLTRASSTLLVTFCVVFKALSLTPFEVCSDFEPTPNSPPVTWGLLDCIEVWKKWGATIDDTLHEGYPDPDILKDVSAVLRRRGTPCTVREEKTLDGTGSSAMRHIAAWLYAKQVGCDWVTPDFNQGDVKALVDSANLDNEETLYCHRTEFVFKFNVSIPLKEGKEARRCASVSWLHYFNMNLHSVPPPPDDGSVVKVIMVSLKNTKESSVGVRLVHTKITVFLGHVACCMVHA